MNFKTHHETRMDINGTHLQGYLKSPYDDLLALFGDPMAGDGYKVDAEWNVRFEDGTVATIYNYKTGRNYLGTDGLDVEDITDWNVGGHTKQAHTHVLAAVIEFLNRMTRSTA
jgi:hypothetical protein